MADAIEGERLSIESLRMKTSRIFKSRAVAKQMFAKSEGDDEIDDDDILQRHTDEIRNVLCVLGLGHIAVRPARTEAYDAAAPRERANAIGTAVGELRSLYDVALPAGVTLVLTSSCTSAAQFMGAHPGLFREKTVKVIHIGGAEVQAATSNLESDGRSPDDGQMMLVPDPEAQNNMVDFRSAREFYRLMQLHAVPMVVLTRHMAKCCRLPRALFDVLRAHGGPLGEILFEGQQEAMDLLYSQACTPPDDAVVRMGLPPRCDQSWFAQTFCNNAQIDDPDQVWGAIESLNVYAPMALLAVLPHAFVPQLDPFEIELFSARHQILGLSASSPGVSNPALLRAFMCQCIMKATLANQSEFALTAPPPIPVVFQAESNALTDDGKRASWKFQPSDGLFQCSVVDDREPFSSKVGAIEHAKESTTSTLSC